MQPQDPALDSFEDDIIESGHEDALDNPQRGCGTLEHGKCYIRGVMGGGGVLPPFVRCDPPLPFREIGTDGSFTRGFQHIDGVSLQVSLEEAGDYEFTPLANVDYSVALERMVEMELYVTRRDIPETEIRRHLDRLAITDPDGDHWGEIDMADQTDLLMRAGKTHYPEPEDFIEECVEHGLSKAIPVSPRNEPPTVVPGITRCWIMHPEALDDGEFGGGIIGYTYLGEVVFTEPEEGDLPEYVTEYEQNGDLRVADIKPPEEPGPKEDLDEFSN